MPTFVRRVKILKRVIPLTAFPKTFPTFKTNSLQPTVAECLALRVAKELEKSHLRYGIPQFTRRLSFPKRVVLF